MHSRRFSLPPVTEASYEPRQIPNAGKEMEGSVILRPTREQWLSMLGEMVQMVNEAVRRRAASIRDASKPLSLEYMGDRLDVDDPLTGYLAVTEAEGWMQGFITCTTFTTWHHHFRWDSTHPALDLLDHAAPGRPRPAIDEEGDLSMELQAAAAGPTRDTLHPPNPCGGWRRHGAELRSAARVSRSPWPGRALPSRFDCTARCPPWPQSRRPPPQPSALASARRRSCTRATPTTRAWCGRVWPSSRCSAPSAAAAG